jgi:hypothetical protein
MENRGNFQAAIRKSSEEVVRIALEFESPAAILRIDSSFLYLRKWCENHWAFE